MTRTEHKEDYSHLTRPIVTEGLTKAAQNYWIKKVFSTYSEVGMRSKKMGSLRADVIALSMKREIVICEVKSCWSDFKTDTKWMQYKEYCDKMYFVIHRGLCDTSKGELIIQAAKEQGVGVMRLGTDGKLSVVQNAKRAPMCDKKRDWLITKLAWRGGDSRYNNKRVQRVYL